MAPGVYCTWTDFSGLGGLGETWNREIYLIVFGHRCFWFRVRGCRFRGVLSAALTAVFYSTMGMGMYKKAT